jgi:hypothetical protein
VHDVEPASAASTLGERYHAFVRNLPPRSQAFLRLVEERGTVTIGEVMRALGLLQPKAMGGITGSIGRWAPVKQVPLPYEQLERDGERAWRWIGIPGVTRGAHVPPPKPRSAPAIVAEPETPPTPVRPAPAPARPAPVAPKAPEPAAPVVKAPAPVRPTPVRPAPIAPVAPPAPRGRPRLGSPAPVVEVKGRGVIGEPPPPPAPAPTPPPAPAPTPALAPAQSGRPDRYFGALPDSSRQFMARLQADGSLAMAEALKMFGLNRPKALGGILEPIKRIAREHGIDVPFEVGSGPDGNRVWYWPGMAPAAPAAAEAPAPAAPPPEPKGPPPGVLRRKKP